ncbi:hypothetical protein NOCA2670011 [metagenome]|uniref:Uncharacterized protein n=1 Tax=metagenome TaxID=256318 RepID=A0A2P2CCK3_9ZZZZ
MPSMLIDPSYAQLSHLAGQQVDAMVEGGCVRLWLEHVSTPATFADLSSFTVRLTGPVDQPLIPGVQLLSSERGDFVLMLEAVAADIRHLHYEAFLVESPDRATAA